MYTLNDICSVITDGSHFSPEDEGVGYPMLSVKDMGETDFEFGTCKYVGEEAFQKLLANGCKPEINDVVVAKDGSYLKTAFPIKEDRDIALLSSIAILRPKLDLVVPDYLSYFLKSKSVYRTVSLNYVSGTALKRMILKGIKKIPVALPNVEEQERRTELLDRIHGIIQQRKKQLEELDALIKARFVEMFGDPSLNTKGYPIKSLPEIADYWNGLPEDISDKGTIVLRSSNIQNAQLDFADTVRVTCSIGEKKYVQNNDILMCSRNGSARLVGKVALIKDIVEPMSFGAFMMIIRSPYYPYLMTFFQMPAFRTQITTGATTTINQITGRMLDSIKLPIPEKDELESFIAFTEQVDKSKVA